MTSHQDRFVVLLTAALVVLTACTTAGGEAPGSTRGSGSASEATSSTTGTPPPPATPSPTPPAPTPTTPAATTSVPAPTPSLTRVEQAFAGAFASIQEYVALAGEIEKNGGEGWEALKPWWGNEHILQRETAYYEEFLTNQMSTIGYDTVRDPALLNVTIDTFGPGLDEVAMIFCVDSSHSERRDIDGKPISIPDTLIVTVTMQQVDLEGKWTMAWMNTQLEPRC